jgi:hypothetical protein
MDSYLIHLKEIRHKTQSMFEEKSQPALSGENDGPEKSRLNSKDGCNATSPLRLLAARCLLGKENSLDVWQDATLCDGDTTQQFVQFLVVSDGELKMTGDDPGFLVVSGGVTCQLEDFGGEILQYSCQIDGSSGADSLGVVSPSQEAMNTSHWELKSCSG